MPEIQILSPHLADLIAAGEVVERPASVVKELVENAFDAGARTVTVELRGGGATYLRVTDDGCGMEPVDARTAFLRHATSKLRTAADLAAIGTLGFRGEALAAIAAVSAVRILTKSWRLPRRKRPPLPGQRRSLRWQKNTRKPVQGWKKPPPSLRRQSSWLLPGSGTRCTTCSPPMCWAWRKPPA